MKSYTTIIASRKFYREFKRKISEPDTIYLEECLTGKLFSGALIDKAEDSPYIMAIRNAYLKLSEGHRTTIELLVIDEIPSLTAFDTLKKYIHPRVNVLNGMTKEEYFAGLAAVQKQNRVSLLKGAALNKLHELFNKELNNKKNG